MSDYAAVVNHIPFGRENAVSRRMLAQQTGMTDRQVRRCIEDARRDGVFIISDQERGGYYQTAQLNEIEYQYRIDRARALAVLARLKPMSQVLREAGRLKPTRKKAGRKV